MSNVTVLKGDLFASDAAILCDAVNCMGPHAAGIAAQFEKRYPEYSAAYKIATKSALIGFYHPIFAFAEKGKVIAAVPTMTYPGEDTQPELLFSSLMRLKETMRRDNVPAGTKVAMPALGCGIGGLDFEVLEYMVRAVFFKSDYKIELYRPL